MVEESDQAPNSARNPKIDKVIEAFKLAHELLHHDTGANDDNLYDRIHRKEAPKRAEIVLSSGIRVAYWQHGTGFTVSTATDEFDFGLRWKDGEAEIVINEWGLMQLFGLVDERIPLGELIEEMVADNSLFIRDRYDIALSDPDQLVEGP